jgi:predicted RNase H-like nuclease
MGARFLGLDLAWSTRHPSGAAVLDEAGRVLDARADLGDDAAVLAWVRAHLAETTTIGIDMPTIVRNATGIRPCERELAAEFRAFHAAPHPANLRRFPDGGRARRLLDALVADGVEERLALAPRATGRFAFEVFPHPAHVRLFSRDAIFRYKKKARPWPDVLAAWAAYRAALASLAAADPPLHLPASIPERVEARGYKRWDDLLDGITCAYVASYLWRHGTAAPYARVYGDLTDGYIVVPGAAVFPRRSAGGRTATLGAR